MLAALLLSQLAASAALQTPIVRQGASSSDVIAATSGRELFGRRAALSSSIGAAALFAANLVSPASAYDAIPSVESNFAEAELKRKQKDDNDRKLTIELVKFLKKIEQSTTEADFIPACDALAVWVIGQGSVPDGIGIKNLVKRVTLAFDNLPKRSYKCEKTRDNGGYCYSPGRGAELAYEALIKVLRKYTIIQLGDYRRVEFNAF